MGIVQGERMSEAATAHRAFERSTDEKNIANPAWLSTTQDVVIRSICTWGQNQLANGVPRNRVICEVLQRWADLLLGSPDSYGNVKPASLAESCGARISQLALEYGPCGIAEGEGYGWLAEGQCDANWITQLLIPRVKYLLMRRDGAAVGADVQDPGFVYRNLPKKTFSVPPVIENREALYEAAKSRHPEWADRGFAQWCRDNGFDDSIFGQWRRRQERKEKLGALKYPDSSPQAQRIAAALRK
jgi:hypothetical protein